MLILLSFGSRCKSIDLIEYAVALLIETPVTTDWTTYHSASARSFFLRRA